MYSYLLWWYSFNRHFGTFKFLGGFSLAESSSSSSASSSSLTSQRHQHHYHPHHFALWATWKKFEISVVRWSIAWIHFAMSFVSERLPFQHFYVFIMRRPKHARVASPPACPECFSWPWIGHQTFIHKYIHTYLVFHKTKEGPEPCVWNSQRKCLTCLQFCPWIGIYCCKQMSSFFLFASPALSQADWLTDSQ